MRCEQCSGTLQSDHGEGLVLECAACALFPVDCRCRNRLPYLPHRWVHCLNCERMFIEQVDTTKSEWRSIEV